MNYSKLFLLFILFCFMPGMKLIAQEVKAQNTEESKQEQSPQPAKNLKPITTIDSTIPLDQLKIMVRPLTKTELQVEATAWFELLRNKARQIAAARLGVKKTNEAISTTDEQQAVDSLRKAEMVQQTADKIAKKAEEKLAKQAQENLGVDHIESAAKSDESLEAPKPTSAESKAHEIVDTAVADVTATQSAEVMKQQFLDNLMKLQDERTALSDRLEVVLASWKLKGGT